MAIDTAPVSQCCFAIHTAVVEIVYITQTLTLTLTLRKQL